MKKTNLIRVVLSTLLICISTATYAYKIVFDPQNFTKNVVTAAQTLKIEVEQVKQRIQQYQQLQTMYQNLAKSDPSSYQWQVNDIKEKIKVITDYKQSLVDVNSALGGQAQYLDNIQRNYAMSNSGNFEEYMTSLQQRADAGELRAQHLMNVSKSVSSNIENTTNRRRELQSRVQNVTGILESSQTTNQYLDTIVAQNNDLARIMSENALAMAEERKSNAMALAEKRKADLKATEESKKAVKEFEQSWTRK